MSQPIIQQRFRSHAHDLGGGFSVNRVLPGSPRRAVGPFVFIDYFGPVTLPADRPMDVRPHPHIGLSTLTYLWQGRIHHRDSLGSDQRIEPGAVNWMTAGRGIVHSERTAAQDRGKPMPLHGLQLWLALPQADEEAEPSFSHTPADRLPRFSVGSTEAVLIVGSAWQEHSPVPAPGEPLLVDLRIPKDAELELPAELADQRALFLVSGEVFVGEQALEANSLSVFRPSQPIPLRAGSDVHAVLFGGPPLDAPRHLWWNYVSSSEAKIEQARADWREGRFAGVAGDEEFIPLPQDDRPSIRLMPE